MTNQIEAPKPVGKFMFERLGSRWHHVKHGEAQFTEPRLDMVKLYSEETVSALIAALEQSQRERDDLSHKDYLTWHAAACKFRQRAEAAEKRISELEAIQLAVKLPSHKFRECVNGLLEEAIAYAGTQQLRTRLSSRLSNFVKPDHEAGITVQGDE